MPTNSRFIVLNAAAATFRDGSNIPGYSDPPLTRSAPHLSRPSAEDGGGASQIICKRLIKPTSGAASELK